MTSAEENVSVAMKAIESFSSGDLDAVLDFVGPEMETRAANNLANTGCYYGRDGFLEWSAEWLDAWESWKQEVDNYEAVGEHHVVADAHQHGVGRGSGVPVEMKLAYMFEIHAGKGRRFHLYANRDQAVEAARTGEQAGG